MKKLLIFTILIISLLLVSCSNKVSNEVNTQEQMQMPQEQVQEEVKPNEIQVTPETNSQEVNILIKSFKFTPAEQTVSVGTKVTWINQDGTTHTVETKDGKLDSGRLENGESWSFTFNTPGTYDYVCGLHSSMKGKIIVQ